MKKRLEGLDIARAFAILGMMFVNYALVFQVAPTSALAHLYVGLEGRAAAVFMIVAGIGIGILSKKGVSRQLYGQLIKRSLFLWVLGLLLYVVFDWTADILHYYGLFMLCIIPFLSAKKKTIGIGIAVTLLVSSYLQFSQNYLSGWDFMNLKYVDFWTVEGFIRNLGFNGFHPLFPWFAFMLIGLLLSRMPLSERAYQKKMICLGVSIALMSELISKILSEFLLKGHWLYEFIQTKPMPPNLLYMLAATGWAIAFICLCLRAADALTHRRSIIEPLVYTGQLSLTHYVGHSALVLGVLDAFGMIQAQNAYFVLLLTVVVYIGMMVLSVTWRKYFDRGPIELVMRKISDGEQSNA